MTPAPPKHAPPSPVAQMVVAYIFMLLFFTPVIALAWNLGLHGAGIVDHTIDWMTALGLSFVVMVARAIVSAARPATMFIGR